jgi:hypothetical protein
VGEHGLVVPGGVTGRVALPAEHPQVDVHCTAVVPAQIPRRHGETGLPGRRVSQVVQLAAQVRQRLRVRRIRPEQGRDPLAGLRGAGVHGEERGEREGPGGPRPGGTGRVVHDGLFAQEHDP